MSILWLGEPSSDNTLVVGAKAANLSILNKTHRIPPGFIIPAKCFSSDEFSFLKKVISIEYKKLSSLCNSTSIQVAVRSSGLFEDSDSASFAGQHKTYLCIQGEEQLLDAIMKCGQSAMNQASDAYREHMSIELEEPALSVIVQQMIPSDVSGVVFTVNPISGNTDEIILNTSWGLGESIVNGSVTPDSYIVRKSNFDIILSEINEKNVMTVSTPNGPQEIDVPKSLQYLSSLTENQILQVANLANALETAMGMPIDAEYAYYHDDLFLLQCRPISTLQ
jgi:pyruvate,water dikinase